MGDYIVLAISCILINNILLMQYLGNCPFLGTSKRMETATGMAMAVVFVLVLAGLITWIAWTYFLVPLGLEYLRTVAFILIIAALVQFVELFLKKSITALYRGLGIFLPLITTNCAVLGVAFINVDEKYTFLQTRNVALPFTPGSEPRAALEIITVLPSGDTIAFVGTHLDHLRDEKDRIAQVKKINEVFSLNKYPTILAGDLNARPGSVPINILEEMWSASYDKENPKPTFPSRNPSRKIDYVMFYPKNMWKIIETEVIQDSIASDHCAYLVTLKLINE